MMSDVEVCLNTEFVDSPLNGFGKRENHAAFHVVYLSRAGA